MILLFRRAVRVELPGIPTAFWRNDLVLGINTAGNTTKCYRFTALVAFDATNPNADHAAMLSP
jgi:hypothetical protein